MSSLSVFEKRVWCYRCPTPSCRATETDFLGRNEAEYALFAHLVECHD